MRKANLFIVGGAKCGTTSLNYWLASHPQIYMSPYKEPNYFCTDIQAQNTKIADEYAQLFTGATSAHILLGEASVHYMYSTVAITNILAYNPQAKFIVMVRNPIDMAFSLYQHEHYSTYEREKTFEQAWDLQTARANGSAKIPSYCDVKLLLYGERCKLGHQLARLYKQVDANQVHVIVLDDIKKNTRQEYVRLLTFLEVPDDGRVDFPVYNEAKVSKSVIFDWGKIVYRYVTKHKSSHQEDPTWIKKLKTWIKKDQVKMPMKAETREKLKIYYREDILMLSKLLQRDFSNWLT